MLTIMRNNYNACVLNLRFKKMVYIFLSLFYLCVLLDDKIRGIFLYLKILTILKI